MLFLRDTILHIEDKETLFANFLKWLKPGGKLMISGGFHNGFWFVDKVQGHIWLVVITIEPTLLWNHSQTIAAHQMNGHLTMLHMLNREGTISTLLPTMVSNDFDLGWPSNDLRSSADQLILNDLIWPHMTVFWIFTQFLGKIIEKVGFENVQAIDKTKDFISILSNELEIFAKIKDEFLAVSFN